MNLTQDERNAKENKIEKSFSKMYDNVFSMRQSGDKV